MPDALARRRGDKADLAPPRPTALVLDFGGVVCRLMFELHDATERVLGLSPGTLAWRGPFDPDSDPLWRDMLADRITERAYWQQRTREIGRLVGEAWTEPHEFMRLTIAADLTTAIRPEAVSAIHAAKAAGFKLAILSNEMDLFFGADLRARLPLLGLFDAIVDATYTGILKPDARAYAACAEALGLDIGQCLMVDDQPRNVAGARVAGMQGLQFDVLRPAESYRRVLERLGAALPSRHQAG